MGILHLPLTKFVFGEHIVKKFNIDYCYKYLSYIKENRTLYLRHYICCNIKTLCLGKWVSPKELLDHVSNIFTLPNL